jgi:hypothetical protein
VKVIRALDGRELVSDTTRASSEDALQDWIENNAARLGDEIVLRVRGRPARGGPGWLRFAVLGGGAAVAATGAVLLGLAFGTVGSLRSAEPMTAMQIDDAVAAGRVQQLAGFSLLAAGAVVAAVSAVLFGLYDPGTQASVTISWLPSGGGALFSWVLP